MYQHLSSCSEVGRDLLRIKNPTASAAAIFSTMDAKTRRMKMPAAMGRISRVLPGFGGFWMAMRRAGAKIYATCGKRRPSVAICRKVRTMVSPAWAVRSFGPSRRRGRR